MGAFFYFAKHHGSNADVATAKHARSLQALEQKGLSDSHTLTCKEIIERDAFVIYVYEKIGCKTENILHLTADDFILSTGTLIYKKRTGKNALRDLYLFVDFSPSGAFFNDLQGHFCIFVYKEGNLYVFNDYFGVYQVFHNDTYTVISNSFLSVVRSLNSKAISKQALYEYISDGASYADETYIKGVNVLDAFSIHQLLPKHHRIDKKYSPPQIVTKGFDERVEATLGNLVDYFLALKCFGESVCTALSGGYDSRLILALLTKVGIKPFVFVYGGSRSRDVVISKAIGEGEGIAIHHDIKHVPVFDIERFLEIIRLEYFYCDGCGPNGAFTNGAEMSARAVRTNAGRLQLNGGGGEIFRNFWKLPDQSLTISAVLKSKYDFLARSVFSSKYDKDEYFEILAEKVKRMLRIDQERLSRQEIEMLYVYMRVKYWMGYNTSIQNFRTFALIPLTEPVFAFPSWQIPIDEKDLGRFEAALICRLNPCLAAYSSAYGFNFADDIPLTAKIKNFLVVNSPIPIRPSLRKLKQCLVHHRPKPFFLQQKYVGSLLNKEDSWSAEFVNVENLHDPLMISRAYTVDLVMADPF